MKQNKKFKNDIYIRNQMNLLKWLFLSNDSLKAVVILYRSKLHSVSPRYFPLFASTNEIRVVIHSGLPIRGYDRIGLKLHSKLIKLVGYKIKRYKWHHITNPNERVYTNQILHLDDPNYDSKEAESVTQWDQKFASGKPRGIMVCTNDYALNHFRKILRYTQIAKIEQGFDGSIVKEFSRRNNKADKLKCVFVSPYIDYIGDKHQEHPNWNSKILIDEIIPRLDSINANVEVHLVGRVGTNAHRKIEGYNFVVEHGALSFEECSKFLREMHIGLYPRTFDNKRSAQKIAEYIGACLPIVSFDLVDSELVKKHNIGIVVKNVDEFVSGIVGLENDFDHYERLLERILTIREKYSWRALGKTLEGLQNENDIYS